MINIQPKTPTIVGIDKLGDDQLRITHSVLEDYDATSIICYIYVATIGELDYTNPVQYTSRTIYDVDRREVGFFVVDLPAISAGEEYIVEIAVLDAFGTDAGATATGTINKVDENDTVYDATWGNVFVTNRDANIINISEATRLSPARGVYINNLVEIKPDSFSASTPAYINAFLTEDDTLAESISIEYATGYSSPTLPVSWTSLYLGSYQPVVTLSTGLVKGTSYVFRVVTTFKDGSVATPEYYDQDPTTSAVEHDLIELVYDAASGAPVDPSALTFTAYTVWDGSPSYDLYIDWTWAGAEENYIKQFEIQYIQDDSILDATDASTLDWSDPSIVSAGSGVRRSILSAFPADTRYAFRIRAISWGAVADKYSNWSYGKVLIGTDAAVTYDITPTDGVPPSGTNIQIDKNYIRAYNNWNGTTGDITFQVDAQTGDLQIGNSSGFFYDASSEILTLDGSLITTNIVASDFVMDWVAADTPSFRTANRDKVYNSLSRPSGLWMGYTDGTTFQFDIGDSEKFIRWDGTDLEISGRVKILSDASATPGDIGYVNLLVSSTHHAVVFDPISDAPETDVTAIISVTTTDSNIGSYNWDVVRSDTDAAISANLTMVTDTQYTVQITDANNVMSSGYTSIKIRVFDGVDYDSATIRDYVTISRVDSGSTVTGFLTNEAHNIPTDSDGNNGVYTGATGTFKVYEGSTDVSGSATFSEVLETDVTGSITAGGVYTVTGLTADTGSYTVRAVYNGVTIDKVFSLSKSIAGTQGDPGNAGAQGTRGPIFSPGSSTSDPTLDATWDSPTGATSVAGVIATANGGGQLVQYDVLTLRLDTDSSVADTRMWDGSAWTTPNLIDGDQVITGTLSANRIAGTEGFFEEIGVNTIYNHGANDSTYTMKIDFAGGVIHIRG